MPPKPPISQEDANAMATRGSTRTVELWGQEVEAVAPPDELIPRLLDCSLPTLYEFKRQIDDEIEMRLAD